MHEKKQKESQVKVSMIQNKLNVKYVYVCERVCLYVYIYIYLQFIHKNMRKREEWKERRKIGDKEFLSQERWHLALHVQFRPAKIIMTETSAIFLLQEFFYIPFLVCFQPNVCDVTC